MLAHSVHGLKRTDAGTSLLEGLPELAAVVADGRDDTQAGDSHPVGHVKRRPLPDFLDRYPEVLRYRRLHLEPNVNSERLRPEY